MRKPLTLYTVIPHIHTASFYYRLEVPILTARDLGLPLRATIDVNDPGTTDEDRARAFCESDLILLYQPLGEGPINNIRNLQNFLPSRRDGDWKWPPTVIIESDDNLFNVSPLNQAFKNLGIRDMNGTDIPTGHHIGVVTNGEKRILWKDGENGFSIARNRQAIASYRTIIEMADAVSTSTPPVADAIKKEVKPRRIETWPNLVRFQDYEQADIRDDDKLHILWQGGIAHYEDWFPLREALGNITKRYPNVHWDIWGAQFPWVNELIPAGRYTYHQWCSYQEYKLRLALMNHDIALAPLSDNRFNCCRSAIKWYEASVLKKDIPTLAQNTSAYQREMVDGETGLLFNDPQEFEDKLATLIENAELRQRLGRNAKDWIHENRDAMKKVPALVAWWEQLREERKTEQPRVTDKEWERIEAEFKAEQEEAITA